MLVLIKRFLNFFKTPITLLQLPILYISYYFFKINKNNETKISWVIGVDEIASNIFFLKQILKPSTNVSFSKNKYYNLKYDYNINIENIYLKFLFRFFYGPLLLGYLINKNTHFWYIWHSGFLLNRDFEFKFLKKKKIIIICMFVGDDIRSIKLTNKYGKENKIDVNTNYYTLENEYMLSNSYDLDKKKIAVSADKYADIVFSHKKCQMSYLQSKQYSWPYMFDKNKFFRNNKKFENFNRIKILHAPSSPLFKGTPLVRAVIKKLEIDGYNIEYTELQDTKNEIVLEHLKSTHIVLNQFYCFTPGLFGIEAMANHCAVLMSADSKIEQGLPQNCKDAWMITRYWELYSNLKYLLDNTSMIKYYADNGYDFAYKHYTYEAAGEFMRGVLAENKII
jgi:hypothetical protein